MGTRKPTLRARTTPKTPSKHTFADIPPRPVPEAAEPPFAENAHPEVNDFRENMVNPTNPEAATIRPGLPCEARIMTGTSEGTDGGTILEVNENMVKFMNSGGIAKNAYIDEHLWIPQKGSKIDALIPTAETEKDADTSLTKPVPGLIFSNESCADGAWIVERVLSDGRVIAVDSESNRVTWNWNDMRGSEQPSTDGLFARIAPMVAAALRGENERPEQAAAKSQGKGTAKIAAVMNADPENKPADAAIEWGSPRPGAIVVNREYAQDIEHSWGIFLRQESGPDQGQVTVLNAHGGISQWNEGDYEAAEPGSIIDRLTPHIAEWIAADPEFGGMIKTTTETETSARPTANLRRFDSEKLADMPVEQYTVDPGRPTDIIDLMMRINTLQSLANSLFPGGDWPVVSISGRLIALEDDVLGRHLMDAMVRVEEVISEIIRYTAMAAGSVDVARIHGLKPKIEPLTDEETDVARDRRNARSNDTHFLPATDREAATLRPGLMVLVNDKQGYPNSEYNAVVAHVLEEKRFVEVVNDAGEHNQVPRWQVMVPKKGSTADVFVTE